MPEVNVEINGRKYRMACEEGQELHLMGLAKRFNVEVERLKGAVGEVGDTRLTVMAGIAVLDELELAERRIMELMRDVEQLTAAGEAMAAESEEVERRFAKKLAEAARRVESIATAIDEAGTAPPPA